MSGNLETAPAATTGRQGAAPARRAVVRWSWRLFRREWRQQLLVLALVTMAVAAAVAGASITVNAASSANGRFGDADSVIQLDGAHPKTARAGVAQAKQRFGAVEVIRHTSLAVPGSAEPLDLRAQDPHGVYGHSMLALRAGRYPIKSDEVALTSAAARLLDTAVGEQVTLGGVRRTVVGRVENPADLNDQFALIAPNVGARATSWTLLVRRDAGTGDATAVPSGVAAQVQFQIEGRPTNHNAVTGAVLVVTTLAMALVGLIATAGFVVVAQRRQRQLGLLAAIGATERHLRLVMLANGVIVGMTAALVGGALGVLGWIVAAPAVESAAAHRIGRLDLPWGLIVECMLIAVVAATAAAWWPARLMARLPVMSALSGRPSKPRPVHRSLAVAVALLIAGFGSITAAAPTSNHVKPLVLIGGILAVVVGLVLAAPAAIRTLAMPARRLPFASRLALRDLVRYQTRAAAALTAITLVLGISVTVVVIGQANQHRASEGNLSDRQLVIRVGDPRTAPNPSVPRADRTRLDAAAARIAAGLGRSASLTLDVAINPSTAKDPSLKEPVALARPISHGFNFVAYPFVATPRILARYGIDPTTIRDRTDLLTSHPGNVVLVDMTVRPDDGEAASVTQHIDLPKYTSAPSSLVTERALARHGWVAARAGWLIETPTPITAQQVRAARGAAATAGLTIEVRDAQGGIATLQLVATLLGALLALGIVAMTIGLIRSESASELRTLTATGATAHTRRTLTASTACALALLGALLGIGGAYVALIAGYHADLGRLSRPPVVDLFALALGLPFVAAVAGWLLAGREPGTLARQALD